MDKTVLKQNIVRIKIWRISSSKILKAQNFPENTQKPKIQKIKKSCKDSSNEKYFENKL